MTEKEKLLQNPLVKEIATEYLFEQRRTTLGVYDFDKFVSEQMKSAFTILTFTDKTQCIYMRSEHGRFCTPHYYTEEEMLSSKYFSIHSVRRESDGVVFKVGNLMSGGCGRFKITRITFDKPNYIWLHYFSSQDYTYSLQEAKLPEDWNITCWRDKNNINSHSLRKVNSNFEIYSVRRSRDTVEFTVGSMVTCGALTKPHPISKIYTTSDAVRIQVYTLDVNILADDLQLFVEKSKGWEIVESHCLDEGNETIIGVKRLSDNVVFRVGDRFRVQEDSHEDCDAPTSGTIVEFVIYKGDMCVKIDKKQTHCIPYLSALVKVERLLNTMDSKDIYEGDPYCMVDKRTLEMHCVKKASADTVYDPVFVYFYNIGMAQRYIEDNTNCISIQDLKILGYSTTPHLLQLVNKRVNGKETK